MNYSGLARSLEPSATLQLTARARELQRSGRRVVALSAGQPDFPTPAAAAEAAARAVAEGHTGYTATPGIPELREEIARLTGLRRGMSFEPAEVIVSCGAKHCLANLLLSAVEPGDAVLLPRPYWVSYPEMVKLAGGVPVYPAGGGLLPGAADIEEAASKGVRGVILNSPGNPTGCVYSRGEADDLAKALEASGMWVISDDIYEDLCYTGHPAPHVLDAAPGLRDRTAVVSGVSKTYSMTGWRIGWAVAPRDWIRFCTRIQEHTTSNPSSVSQWASLAVLGGGADADKARMHEAFRARRDLMADLLGGIGGLRFPRPDGAFYVFVDYRGLSDVPSADAASALLEEHGLAVIPGSAFGSEGWLRLSFAASDADIREGVALLAGYLGKGSGG
jgi:aspartate aminotransferase